MKKRGLGYLLAIVLCLSMLPVTVMASGAAISLNKTVYAPGERIIIEVSGITPQMVADDAFVSIYEAGAAHSEWGRYFYVKAGTSQVELPAPDDRGSYEMRLYRKDNEYTDETFVMNAAFRVGDVSVSNPGVIELDKDAYLANSEIPVKAFGITEQMEKDGAFVAIYKIGAEHDQWGVYAYPKAGDSTIKLIAPNLNGDFEMRLYTEDHYYSDATFVMSIPFKLSGATPPKGSAWASGDMERAEVLGLIPASIKQADLTKPITREEFCEIALLLYEKSTGSSPAPAPVNPFTDTTNPQILKAYALGITGGTSVTTFSPRVPITREQCATMLFRAIKAINPGGDYSIAGIPDFPDQKDISDFAVAGTKYMSKLGIVKGGAGGNFMPKATTTAQQAANYGMATREAAIIMSLRTYDQMDTIKAVPENNETASSSASVAGSWVLGTLAGGKFNAASGRYEGGASGLGHLYNLKPDGTYTALSIWSGALYFTGKYNVKDGVLALTERAVAESNDDGKTWGATETLPDTSAYFTVGTDDAGKYLLLGEEGAIPPLVDKTNALKYRLQG
ncbi:MAG: S-layer homology domain-containing protein [bacterium]|jgi:hypothetical protein